LVANRDGKRPEFAMNNGRQSPYKGTYEPLILIAGLGLRPTGGGAGFTLPVGG